MNKSKLTLEEFSRRGGKASAAKLTPAQRTEKARKAGRQKGKKQ